jgi:hypothetical protein
MNRLPHLLVLLLTACAAADAGDAPDAPDLPILQRAEDVPYCTRDSQCGKGGSCVDNLCVGELEEHVCYPDPCTEADGPSCVDTSNDAYNCGGCGLKCPWGTAKLIGCTDGLCYRVEPTAEEWANIEAAE